MTSPEYKTICTLAVRGAIIKYNWYKTTVWILTYVWSYAQKEQGWVRRERRKRDKPSPVKMLLFTYLVASNYISHVA